VDYRLNKWLCVTSAVLLWGVVERGWVSDCAWSDEVPGSRCRLFFLISGGVGGEVVGVV